MPRPIPTRNAPSTGFILPADVAAYGTGDELGFARLNAGLLGSGPVMPNAMPGPPRAELGNAKDDAFSTDEATNVSGSVFADNGQGADITPGGIIAVNGSAGAVGNQITLASGALLTVNENGSFTYNLNGAFNYVPAAGSGATNLTATDHFTYTLVNGDSATAVFTISGLDTNDALNKPTSGGSLTGGVGNDTYILDGPIHTIVENVGEGFDAVYVRPTIYSLTAGAEVEWLSFLDQASTADGSLFGNEFRNYVLGNNGANGISGGAGADWLYGFGGADTYYVDDPGDVIFENNPNDPYDALFAYVSYTLAPGVLVETMSIHPTAAGLVNLTGNEIANTINGNSGDNVLDGGGGADRLVGKTGNDTYILDNAGDQVFENAGEGFDAIYTSFGLTLAAGLSIEWLSTLDNSQTTALNFTGNEFDNYIFGNAGSNTLNGGTGVDRLYGFGGSDTYVVDNSADTVNESAGGGFDALYTSVSFTLAAGSEVEWLSTADNSLTTALNLTGNEFDNYIFGNAGDNFLFGGGGADKLYGFGGNDSYFVDNAGDTVNESAGGGTDEVRASVSYTLAAGVAVETLATITSSGTEAINLTGNELANAVSGNDGVNTLNGGLGLDTLTGRGGADNFAFNTALGAGNVDAVSDFVAGTDKIALDDAIFTAIGAPGGLNANAFVVGTAAGDADDRIIYNSTTGALFYDADGNGAGAAVQFATLTGMPVIAASDFTVI